MKIINVLLVSLLTGLAGAEGVKAQSVCNQAGFPCPCDGQCYANCSNGACPSDANCNSCPSRVHSLPQPKNGGYYIFSSGTFFICDFSNKNLKPLSIPKEKNIYSCSEDMRELAQQEINKQSSITIKVDPQAIYRLEKNVGFQCAKAPVLIKGTISVEGLPSQYYTCPVASSNKLKDREVTPNK